ncbi:MAG: DUF4124 domain-containing protein [Burkholderiales bacterium]|nr:DUF4124 domain-containing protein [Burkholderiales bacterium]
MNRSHRRSQTGSGAANAAAAALCGLLALAGLAAPEARAQTYKWVDEKGVVHYTDKIPPEAINKGNVVLDKQGVAIKRTEPALTPEQRRAMAEEAARAEQLARERDLVDRRDRALLATYTMESEIDLARKRALTTIDAQVQSSSSYSATLGKRKAELDKRVADLAGKPVPAVLERELANIADELAKQHALVAAKQKEIVVVNARYDADKKRWKELRAATEAMSGGMPRSTPISARQ